MAIVKIVLQHEGPPILIRLASSHGLDVEQRAGVATFKWPAKYLRICPTGIWLRDPENPERTLAYVGGQLMYAEAEDGETLLLGPDTAPKKGN